MKIVGGKLKKNIVRIINTYLEKEKVKPYNDHTHAKKGRRPSWNNHKGISPLDTVYKVLAIIIKKKLKSIAGKHRKISTGI